MRRSIRINLHHLQRESYYCVEMDQHKKIQRYKNSDSGEIPVSIYHTSPHFCVSTLSNANNENLRRLRLNTTTSLCSWVEGVFSFIFSGGRLSHAGLSLMGFMHYNFHS